jgi:hypothetical protein
MPALVDPGDDSDTEDFEEDNLVVVDSDIPDLIDDLDDEVGVTPVVLPSLEFQPPDDELPMGVVNTEKDDDDNDEDGVAEFKESEQHIEENDDDIVVPEGAQVLRIPLPPKSTRWAGGDWCQECGEPRQPEDYIRFVHNSHAMHYGARRTYQNLKHFFPGSRIPFHRVQQFVKDCPRCQANAHKWVKDIKPIRRVLIPKDFRTRIGIDHLDITPTDKHGNMVAIVIVNLKTKLVYIYPTKTKDMHTVATAIIQFICTYGLIDEIVSDPGSAMMGKVVEDVNEWLGLRHFVSLVDVHESNGVERTNGEILRHLRALVNDERLKDCWSEPQVIGLIQFALNERINSETGKSAFELTFGSADAKYFHVSDSSDIKKTASEWLVALNDNLKAIKEVTAKYQEELIRQRTASNPSKHSQAVYVAGDLVLYDTLYDKGFRRSKLDNRGRGPYKVIQQIKNDVECKHLVLGANEWLPVDRLTLFSGTEEQAKRLAQENVDQFEIETFVAWRGDPSKRKTMEFLIKFKGTQEPLWTQWSNDLFNSIPYETYCRSQGPLYQLIFRTEELKERIKQITNEDISSVKPGDVVYVTLRYFGTYVYDDVLDLPDKWTTDYVVKLKYTKWEARTHHRLIEGHFEIFCAKYKLNNWFVWTYGFRKELLPGMVEVTLDWFHRYPTLMECVADCNKPAVRRKLHQLHA